MNDFEAVMGAYKGAQVAVFGASGFIGRWVARYLCRAGAELTLFVRDPASAADIFKSWDVRGQIKAIDLSDLAQVREAISQSRPSITFNLAGYGIDRTERDDELSRRINTDLVRVLCEAIAANHSSGWNGLELVHTGSALEYGAIGGHLIEDSRTNPTNTYGKTKLAGTEAVGRAAQEGLLRAATARLFTVYGPGEHDGRLMPSLLAARDGRDLPLTEGLQNRDFTYVEDVVEGLLRLGTSEGQPGEVLNLATGRLMTVRQFIETAAHLLPLDSNRLKFGAISTRPEEMEHADVSNERLRRRLGWIPETKIDAGILKTVRFIDNL